MTKEAIHSTVGMTSEQLEPSEGFSNLMDKLAPSGWVFEVSDPNTTDHDADQVYIGFVLPPYLAHLKEEAFMRLPIRDDDGNLYPGFDLSIKNNKIGMSYLGP